MARRKNLLEAFQAKPDPSGPAPAGGLPFDRPPRRAGGFGQPPRWLFVTVGLLVAFALGFALGRRTPGEAKAAGDARPPAQAPSAPPVNQARTFQDPPGNPATATAEKDEPGASRRIEDSALFDPINVYTVVVASYSKSKASQDLAWATYRHLIDERLAAFPPVESGNTLVVLVGAAATFSELEATETSVKALVRDGKRPYATAYRVRIDKLIPRPKQK